MADSKLDHVRRVHIGGEILQVRSDAPPETIEQVAEVVDSHLRRLMASGTETDKFRLGVLVALHVAGEQFELRAERDEAITARDGILASLSEAIASRELAEAERDDALDALAKAVVERDEAFSGREDSGERDGSEAPAPTESGVLGSGIIDMFSDTAVEPPMVETPGAAQIAAERDAAVERGNALEAELSALRSRVDDLLERLEEL